MMQKTVIRRAGGYGILLWILSFAVFSVAQAIISTEMLQYIVYWIAITIVMLGLAKVFFKSTEPTTKKGLLLGVVTIVVSIIIDIVFYAVFASSGNVEGAEMMRALYSDWKFYVGLVLVLAVYTYAGWEYDGTYSPDDTN